MSIKRINEFPEGSGSLSADDIFLFMDDPSGENTTKKISLSDISAAIGGGNGSGVSDIIAGSYIQVTSLGSNFTVSATGLQPSGDYILDAFGSGNIVASTTDNILTISSSGLIKSDITGITGASVITNIVQLSQSNFDNILTPDPNTLYIIND